MADLLEITTLGGLTIRHNGKLVTGFGNYKVEALLVYLACSARSQSREVLAERLWDERSQKQSFTNLRAVLVTLRKRLAPFVVADRKTIGLDPCHTYRVDVIELESGLNIISKAWEQGSLTTGTASQLEQVLALYRGDFLEGFTVHDGKGFEDWMLLERDRNRSQAIEGLHHLVNSYLEQAAYNAGISQATRLLQLDPLREEAHRQMMLLLARTGQRNAALVQYEMCQKMLREEFGGEPAEETTQLYEQIQSGKLPPPPQVGKPIIVESPVRPHNLPQQPTPFIGRTEELAQIAQVIEDPTCRLLTLVGPGGIGKTRLALQAASIQANNPASFEHGMFFVQLAPLNVPEAIVPAIAEAVHFLFFPGGEPKQQLLEYLRTRNILLVIDNVEHLLAGAGLIAEILQAAPGVKMLITSRERLNIEGESVLRVEGMHFPDWRPDWKLADIEQADHAEYSAIKLFMQSARRVQPDFALTNDNLQYISQICRLVEGMPLGILLAAAWVEVLSPREIVAEIENNLSFLETDRRDVPTRHRSLRAAFDYSWNLLTDAEQDVFRRLSVFRGGFTREAGQQVTNASLKTLMTLVNKSLLRRDSNTGRYDIHELLRQYAEEHLAVSKSENEEAHIKHNLYYADYMAQRWESLKTRRQRAALDEIEGEIDNIRASWQTMIQYCRIAEIHRALNSLWYFMALRSHYQEAIDLFGSAVQALRSSGDPSDPETQVVVAHLLAVQGRFANSLGSPGEGKILIQEALDVLQSIGRQDIHGADEAILIALESLARKAFHYRPDLRCRGS